MKCFSNAIAAAIMILPAANSFGEDNAEREGVAFFESKVRPALAKYCYECHSEESGKSKGGLRVDSRAALLDGGESGPAIVPGDPEKSRLLTAILYRDDDLEMPPKQKMPDSVIDDFRSWIAIGAPDPRVPAEAVVVESGIDVEKGRAYWAFRPPVKTVPPAAANQVWARSEIDGFVLAGLEKKGLRAVRDADPRTLVRRLYFVLTGLPPTPEESADWIARIGTGLRQDAIATLVDHLLGTHAFGERWARHWLDVARFAESTGGGSNGIFPHAWRYRDYVIDAFNEDVPFDRFIREQIAGDLLPIAYDEEWARNLVATGFLVTGQMLVGEEDDQKFFSDLVDEQIDATTRAFLATTVACARCHDHKTDPISQADYYALAGIFRNTATHYGLIKAQARQHTTLLDVTGLGPAPARASISPKELADLRAARDAARQAMEGIMATIRSGGHVNRSTLRRSRTARDRAEMAFQSFGEDGSARVFVMGTQDREAPLETRILARGELDKPGQVVARGFPQVMSAPGEDRLPESTSGSGRLELASWIAAAENPLTARVMANRIWHHLFGAGIVRTVDDFGRTGEAPTHPELLDHLAVRFIENGWSIKKMIREIVLTRTWQLSAEFDDGNFGVDPDNRFLWRMNGRRLEAETIRDAMLAASGILDAKRPTGSLLADVGEGTVGLAVYEPEIRKIASASRSVYLPRVRNVLPEALELFDAPDASLVTGARETTTVPLQALYLMNNAFVREQAAGFAKRVSEKPWGVQLEYAHLVAFGRSPTAFERASASRFAQEFKSTTARDREGGDLEALTAYCHALLCTAEFSCID